VQTIPLRQSAIDRVLANVAPETRPLANIRLPYLKPGTCSEPFPAPETQRLTRAAVPSKSPPGRRVAIRPAANGEALSMVGEAQLRRTALN